MEVKKKALVHSSSQERSMFTQVLYPSSILRYIRGVFSYFSISTWILNSACSELLSSQAVWLFIKYCLYTLINTLCYSKSSWMEVTSRIFSRDIECSICSSGTAFCQEVVTNMAWRGCVEKWPKTEYFRSRNTTLQRSRWANRKRFNRSGFLRQESVIIYPHNLNPYINIYVYSEKSAGHYFCLISFMGLKWTELFK